MQGIGREHFETSLHILFVFKILKFSLLKKIEQFD